MRLQRYFGSTLRTLLVHKVRTGLALSGVGVGVAAVIVSSAIGAGAREEMGRTIGQMGTNLLIIKPLPVKRLVARPDLRGFATTLDVGDYAAIARSPQIAVAAPGVERPVKVKLGAIAMMTTVRGTTPDFLSVRRFEIAAGRCFDAADDQAARRVAVLGARVNAELGDGRPLVGEEIRIRGVPFDVIGILQAKGATADGADQDNQVLVPTRSALRRLFNATWLTTIYASVIEPDRMSEAETALQRLLRGRHQRGFVDRPDDFAIQNTAKTRAIQQEMIASLSRYAAGLATIALLVGGIGILALMVLSVRERTSEIGLRMAVGAEPRDILLQFLLEATALALAGWASGILVGGAAAAALALGTSWAVGVPITAGLASLGMAIIVGLGFGAWPARNAARIPPIQALLST